MNLSASKIINDCHISLFFLIKFAEDKLCDVGISSYFAFFFSFTASIKVRFP